MHRSASTRAVFNAASNLPDVDLSLSRRACGHGGLHSSKSIRERRYSRLCLEFEHANVHRISLCGSNSGGIWVHRESTTALASDNTSVLGAAGTRVVHAVGPATGDAGCPIFWAVHCRRTPDVGINVNGLTECWAVQFRCNTAFVFFALLPAIWTVMHVGKRVRSPARGFPIIEGTGV